MKFRSALLSISIIFVLVFSSCGPINRSTRMKKTPREYTLNYCGEAIKAPKTDWNKKVWVVFSDRDNNATFQNPGGKVKLKEVNFLDPFVVIKEKGDYLRVVKYDTEVVDPNLLSTKFKDRKQAQYYGWIHKSNLLLTRQSTTDIATGFKNKQLSIISDTTSLSEPDLYFVKDSIKTFKDQNLTIENNKIAFYEILHTLKLSSDHQKALVSKKTEVSPDSINDEVIGWIHSSLLKDIGQRLHVNLNSITNDSLIIKDKKRINTLTLSNYAIDESTGFRKRYKALKYSPVTSWYSQDSLVKLKTNIASPVIDQRDNYVFNVNGNKISYSKFKKLEEDLKKINLLFVFEGKEQIIQNFPAMVNVIQNLQPSFENNDDNFDYQFGSVIALQGNEYDGTPLLKKKELTPDYTEFMEYLISETENIDRFSPLTTKNTWSGVRAAVDMAQKNKNETNLLIIMGEAGYSEGVDTLLLNKMTNANCRVLGFQLHGQTDNSNNNFVLQIENMINHYAYKNRWRKREKIVYADQLRDRNKYRESSKNVYALDFPERSMSQGWILFPEKDTNLPLDILSNSIDSLIIETKWDNDNLVNSLYKAFGTVGNYRYRYDSLFIEHFKPEHAFNRKLPTYFSEIPAWYMPIEEIRVPDSISNQIKYHLLLSKDELNELNLFIEYLCAKELDYKYKGKKKKEKKLCNCPDDQNTVNDREADIYNPEYISTRGIRKDLHSLYLSELKTCKVCKIKTKQLKQYTLAEAQRRITGCPAYNPLLEKYTIKDIKKKNIIPDSELDQLITYIKQKKEGLVKYLHNADKFDSHGQTYYWIDQQLLP